MTFIILQHNGATEKADDKDVELINQGMVQGAKVFKRKDGTFIALSSISDVLTEEQYYQKYPDKRPATPVYTAEVNKEYYKSIEKTSESSKVQFRGVLVGLKKFIDEEIIKGIKPVHALELYENKLAKYKRVFVTA